MVLGLALRPTLPGMDSGERDDHASPQSRAACRGSVWISTPSAARSSTITSERTLELADDVGAGTAPQPDLVIWPENASDIDPLRNADAAAEIAGRRERIGAPILVGACW